MVPEYLKRLPGDSNCSLARERLENLIGRVDSFQPMHELIDLDYVLVYGLLAVIRRSSYKPSVVF